VLFGGSDGVVYALNATEKVLAQPLSTVKNLGSKVEGLGIYYGPSGEEHVFVVAGGVKVFDSKFRLLGEVSFKAFGPKKIEIGDIALFQQPLANFSQGIIAVAMKSSLGKQFGIAPLAGVLTGFQIAANTTYHPVKEVGNSKICKKCNYQGFCTDEGKCDCFIGTASASCRDYFCQRNCSGHGKCIGANECQCEKGWDGPDCSFVVVQPSYETEANGEDGDDPAVWIHPTNASLSRVITTTKSAAGAGLTMFDLTGKKLGSISAGEPNNVDVLYNVTLGSRKVDLAYAACRKDDTLCLFEITNNGTLVNVPGGSQPTRKGFKVYGSCVYSSKKTGKNYLFVNAKDATYLQYELTSTPDGQLNTTLVREFIGGNGGQVEGCVSDDENGFIFVGEEPYGLWRFGAEPNSSPEGFLVHSVNGSLFADVEGVTLVPGKTKDDGFILVSCQGASAYNIYQRKSPHAFLMTFTIHPSEDGKVDGVTNTDGVTAVGKKLNKDFPYGILVVHDDVNQLPNGERSSQASFKMLSFEKLLGSQPGLLKQIDREWNPRS
jgi:3-phytase